MSTIKVTIKEARNRLRNGSSVYISRCGNMTRIYSIKTRGDGTGYKGKSLSSGKWLCFNNGELVAC